MDSPQSWQSNLKDAVDLGAKDSYRIKNPRGKQSLVNALSIPEGIAADRGLMDCIRKAYRAGFDLRAAAQAWHVKNRGQRIP